MKKIISIIFAVLLCVTAIIPVCAADSVVEYNNAREFVFNPDSGDLFQNFKGVMPGDRAEQRIVIKNTKQDYPITIYLRAEVDEQYREFLDNIDIVVYCSKTENGEKEVLQSSRASDTGRLSVDTKLGTYMPDEKGYITVSIYVHPEMNNDFKNTIGKIKWIFNLEEGEKITQPSPYPEGYIPGHQDSPQTGVTIAAVAIAVGVIAIAVVVLILTNEKSKKENTDKNKSEESEKR